MLRFFVLFIGSGLTVTAFAQVPKVESFTKAEDEVAERLAEAQADFKQKVDAALAKITKKYDEAEADARNKRKFDLVEALKKERNDLIGLKITSGRYVNNDYKQTFAKAKAKMLAAYDAASGDYLKLQNDDMVRKIRDERIEFAKNPSILNSFNARPEDPRRNNLDADAIVGRWVLRTDGEILIPVDFFGDNSLKFFNGDMGKWSRDGDDIVMKIQDPRMRDGVRVERMKFSEDRLDGRGTNGVAVFAIRIANRREMLKWQQGGYQNDTRRLWRSNLHFSRINVVGRWESGGLPVAGAPGRGGEPEIARTDKYIYFFESGRWTYLTRLGADESLLMSGHDTGWRPPSKGGWVNER